MAPLFTPPACPEQRYKEKYKDYETLPPPVFALGQSATKQPTMVGPGENLPCFTKSGTSRLWNDSLGRWMCAREKAAASGLAVCQQQCDVAKIPFFVDWTSDFGWHQRVGNGQQLQNVGLVLLAMLCKLRLKPTAPPEILDIAPASKPQGLIQLEDNTFLLSVAGAGFKVAHQEDAWKAHQQLHESWYVGAWFVFGEKVKFEAFTH